MGKGTGWDETSAGVSFSRAIAVVVLAMAVFAGLASADRAAGNTPLKPKRAPGSFTISKKRAKIASEAAMAQLNEIFGPKETTEVNTDNDGKPINTVTTKLTSSQVYPCQVVKRFGPTIFAWSCPTVQRYESTSVHQLSGEVRQSCHLGSTALVIQHWQEPHQKQPPTSDSIPHRRAALVSLKIKAKQRRVLVSTLESPPGFDLVDPHDPEPPC